MNSYIVFVGKLLLLGTIPCSLGFSLSTRFFTVRPMQNQGILVLSTVTQSRCSSSVIESKVSEIKDDRGWINLKSLDTTVASCILASVFCLGINEPAFADEYGRETEAPTLGTGESVMICTKRGPLGACLKTEIRTEENENDKSQKYFRQPTELVKRKDDEARLIESGEGNALIERLKKQSEENSEKNELLVYQRTLINDSSASFGPFDGQVLILNEDGKGFTLLANPQAMRLKKAGLIENKKFVRQPTQQELDSALESPSAGPNFLNRFLGSS